MGPEMLKQYCELPCEVLWVWKALYTSKDTATDRILGSYVWGDINSLKKQKSLMIYHCNVYYVFQIYLLKLVTGSVCVIQGLTESCLLPSVTGVVPFLTSWTMLVQQDGKVLDLGKPADLF